MDNSSRAIEASKVLQEEGREDLLQHGVLEQVWVGLKRPKRASSEGVAAAFMACTSPFRSSKKFRQKSAMGRKYVESVNDSALSERFVGSDSPQRIGGAKRGGTRFTRRAGASIWQCIASRGRGAAEKSEVAAFGRMGAEACAHAPVSVCREGKKKKQAPLPSEMVSNRGEGLLAESTLGMGTKLAAPIADRQEPIIDLSDEEEPRKAAVRSNRQGGESRLTCLSGNLPRGEERRGAWPAADEAARLA
ncbi:hypothetical protein NDU88_009195 [Pleurodeles waltl]|uniref:Uncharacterized protein n=1 Tax=Pleurodeles waltl TaxID=8319 RepID=A0AAV7RXU8_PLEWA|nr:hypothetical protein NDU88_009195 [Pleurodeles waltl]